MGDPLVVGFPIYQQSTLLDFAGATQVFGFSNGLFRPVWLSAGGPDESVITTEYVEVRAAYAFDDPQRPKLDVLFVPGGGGGVYDPQNGEVNGVAGAMQDPVMQNFLKTASEEAEWCGSICSGAFVIAAAGLLDNCEASTYWSQRENLALFPSISVAPGFPRFVIDYGNRRFSGGGVSSSIDLACELMVIFGGLQAAETAQLSVQYAPDPPIRSGDPSQAPPEITRALFESQEEFTATIRQAVENVLGDN